MNARQEFEMIEKVISTQTARLDAVVAALTGVLEATKGNPEVAKAVRERLDHEYAAQQSKPDSEHYLKMFNVMREYLQKVVE